MNLRPRSSVLRRRSARSCLALATVLAVTALPAMAQDTPQPTPPAQSSGAIESVYVDARRRDETVQETPLAVTALSPAILESKATMNLGDLQGSAPNILITEQNSGAAATNLSIRGLAFADIEKSFDPTVGVVLDGVFLGTSTGSYMDFFDIASMEVLRGPQGTLFGRNTIGGVINIKRTRPTGEFGGKFDVSYGKFDTFAARGVVNVPVIKDVLAAKFFWFHNETGGFYRNAITGERNGSNNFENFGASFLLTPGDRFEALLTLERQVKNYSPVNANIANDSELFCMFEPPNECNRNSTTDLYTVFIDETAGRYRSPAVTLEMNYDAGVIKLTSVTGYRESKEAQTQDFDSSSSDLYFTDRRQTFQQFSQELRGAGNITDTFDYVVGFYYFKSKYNLFQMTRLFGAWLPDTQDTTGHSESYALFGDFNWQFADRWNLFFGGRWTHDQKQNQTTVFPNAFPHVTTSGSKFTPRVGVDFRPNDDLMFYASWSRGYRSGGFSGRGLTLFSSTTPYGPETVDSYEVGAKTTWFDDRLQFNVAAFYADYKSLQQSATIPLAGGQGNETIVINVGSATLKGIEAELTARPTEELTLNAAVGVLDNNFKGFIVPQGAVLFDYSAVDMIYAPKVTMSLGAEYAVPVSFGEIRANVNYRYISRYDQQISLGPTAVDPVTGDVTVLSNDPRVRADRHNLLDASLTFEFDIGQVETRLTVYGRNLLDDRGPNAAFTVAGLWSFASAREPRTFGVQLGAQF
ncbi:MAG: TonB-dependent receptor [Sphingomonadales bacterium]